MRLKPITKKIPVWRSQQKSTALLMMEKKDKSRFQEKTVLALKTLAGAGLRITTKTIISIALDETILRRLI